MADLKGSAPYPEPPPPYHPTEPQQAAYGPPPGPLYGPGGTDGMHYGKGPNQYPGVGTPPYMASMHHPPPPGGVPVFPMAGYPTGPGGPQVVVAPPPSGQVTSVTVVNVAQWGPYPMQITCPGCRAQVMTSTTASPGLLTWLLSGALVLLGCWLGCCLVPCCVPECQDVDHHCPSCKRHLGTFRRL